MLGIITVNFNQYSLTYEFLDSLNNVKNANNISVFIADVSTKKQPFHWRGKFDVFIQPTDNKGYAFGVNQGIKYFLKKGAGQFCVINNDVYFDKNFIAKVKETFTKTHIFGGKIYYVPGFEYHKDRYKKNNLGKIIWYAGGIIDWDNVHTLHRGVDEVDRGQYDKFEETEFITGCLICFDKKVINKVGFWDESYFLYFEDADFCQRAKKTGFRLFYNPKIILWHKNAQSTGGAGSLTHQKYQNQNRLKFGLEYAPLRTKIHLIKNYLLGK